MQRRGSWSRTVPAATAITMLISLPAITAIAQDEFMPDAYCQESGAFFEQGAMDCIHSLMIDGQFDFANTFEWPEDTTASVLEIINSPGFDPILLPEFENRLERTYGFLEESGWDGSAYLDMSAWDLGWVELRDPGSVEGLNLAALLRPIEIGDASISTGDDPTPDPDNEDGSGEVVIRTCDSLAGTTEDFYEVLERDELSLFEPSPETPRGTWVIDGWRQKDDRCRVWNLTGEARIFGEDGEVEWTGPISIGNVDSDEMSVSLVASYTKPGDESGQTYKEFGAANYGADKPIVTKGVMITAE